MNEMPIVALQALGRSIFQEAEEIMADSKSKYVPVVTGTLRNSGFVQLPRIGRSKVSIVLGYGGAAQKYALRVHENPRTGKTASGSKVGQWKYLEVPFREKSKGMGARIMDRVITRLRNVT